MAAHSSDPSTHAKAESGANKNSHMLSGLIVLAVITTVGLVFFTLYGARYVSMQPLRSKPFLYLVPQERFIGSVDMFPGTLITAYGYTIQAPWVGVASRIQTRSLSGMVFNTGQVVQVHDPSLVIDWRSELTRSGSTFALERLKAAYGTACCETNHAIIKRILYASPEQLHFLQSSKKSMAIGILLTYKSSYVDVHTHEIVAFRSRLIKGFQLGSPARSKSVRLVIFPQDGTEFWLDISSKSAALRQEDIDRMIASFHRQSN